MGDSIGYFKKLKRELEYDLVVFYYSVFIYSKEINQDVKEIFVFNKEFIVVFFIIVKIQKQFVFINKCINR